MTLGSVGTQPAAATIIGLTVPTTTQIAAAVTGFKEFISDIGGDSGIGEVKTDRVQQSTWELATTLTKGRDVFVDEIKHEYGLDRSVETIQTAHGSAMFSSIETAIARSRVDGETESEAESSSRSDLNKYSAISAWNNIAKWNSALDAGSEIIQYSITDNGVLTPETGSFSTLSNSRADADTSNVEPIVTDDSGSIYVWSDPLDGPNVDLPSWMDLSQLDGEDVDQSDLHIIRYAVDGTVVDILGGTGTSTPLIADHPDYGTQTVVDPGLYSDLINTTLTLRDNLSADLTTIVGEIYQQFDIGERDPSDIISNQEILQQFDSGSELTEQSAAAALTARGYSLPSDLDNQVTVTHNDLEGETTGWLFVDSTASVSVTAGESIPASDYVTAQIVYESEVDSSTQSQSLSGDYPLEIVEYPGEEQYELDYQTVDTHTDPSYVVITEEDEILTNRSESSASVVITDGQGTSSTVPVSSVSEYTGDHYDDEVADGIYQVEIPSELETYSAGIDNVELRTGLSFDDMSERNISDPTNPTETRQRVQQNREAWQKINDKLDAIANGGIGAGGGGGSLLGIGIVVAALAVIFGGGS